LLEVKKGILFVSSYSFLARIGKGKYWSEH